MVVPLLVGRESSIRALEAAMVEEKLLGLVTQRDAAVDQPGAKDLYDLGTTARILQMMRLPNGTVKVLVEGVERIRMKRMLSGRAFPRLTYARSPLDPGGSVGRTLEAVSRRALALFEDYVALHKRIPDEITGTVQSLPDRERLAYGIASHLMVTPAQKIVLYAHDSLEGFFREMGALLTHEVEILKLEQKLEDEVKEQVLKNQKEFYLQEQLKAIHRELGGGEEAPEEIRELQQALRKASLPPDARKRAQAEMKKLVLMPSLSPEAAVVRNYLDWILHLPWKKKTRDSLDVEAVARVLDEDHYGLDKVKERVLEYIAVLKLVGHMKGPILCLVGPPGVGKTSLARSIARALGRRFARISLGGIRDEAEVRGHRRTYIGALPGRILQGMRKAGTVNPVMLLDEIDKLASDFRGDPAAALLEVLDPEQNRTFSDHYLELEYDLSQVLFLATGNILHTLPPALRDRMETIQLPSYLPVEKRQIARRFLVPKQLTAHGLTADRLRLSDGALDRLIGEYTRESGVRNLERLISAICRKVARQVAGDPDRTFHVLARDLPGLLKAPPFADTELEREHMPGLATGLAWTEVGGDILHVEVAVVPGRGILSITGQLGDVMKESASAALSYTRSRAGALGLPPDFYRHVDVHVHVPQGAIPKDGPSAGITIAVGLISALTHQPTRPKVAMTGEITLRGRVLPVGGLSEKAVAALRAGVQTILVPRANRKDLDDLLPEVREGLSIRLVGSMDEVLRLAFRGGTPRRPESLPIVTSVPSPVLDYAH
ncbi:MAG: endopeptidase La [Gemmatimonadetes bacterium]|nr:endopeptidase La [Gemmatimonadota bacterium]